MHNCRTLLGLVALAAATAGPSANGQTRTVAFTGQTAAGLPGAKLQQFYQTWAFGAQVSRPVLNDAGQAAFFAFMEAGPGGVTNSDSGGIWSEGQGSLSLVARSGHQAPGVPQGAVFGSFNPLFVLNDQGQVAFLANLLEGASGVDSSNREGIWSEGGGNLHLVARAGQQAPGLPAGVTFGRFDGGTDGPGNIVAFNNAGDTAFRAGLRGAGGTSFYSESLWAEVGGALTMVARAGDQAPGAPAGAVFERLPSSIEPPALSHTGSHTGNIAFVGSLQIGTGGVDQFSNGGIWTGLPGALSLVARSGAEPPGVLGAQFGPFGYFYDAVTVNDAGHVLISANMRVGPGGVTSDNSIGLWSDRHGGLELIAREGSPLPGSDPALKLLGFATATMNNLGQIAARGVLQTGVGGVTWDNAEFIATEVAGKLSMLAREGDPAPGAIDGAVFGDLGSPMINARGQVAFNASLRLGGNVTRDNDNGVWALDPSGVLKLVAREGDLLEVEPGVFETIRGVGAASAGGGSAFNDRGELLLSANTASRAVILVSKAVAVPEPSGSVILLGAVAWAWMLRGGLFVQ